MEQRPAVTWGPERRQLRHHLNGSQPGSAQAERKREKRKKIWKVIKLNLCLRHLGMFGLSIHETTLQGKTLSEICLRVLMSQGHGDLSLTVTNIASKYMIC